MLLVFVIVAASSRLRADTGTCGGVTAMVPFTDVANSSFFCQIAEAYFSGLTNGTSQTTYSPANPVSRDQMAAFVTRTLDQSLKRRSRRTVLGQWWTTTPHYDAGLGVTPVSGAFFCASDGRDVWVTSGSSSQVTRVHASDGRVLGTWTGADHSEHVVSAMGKVFITANNLPGTLYMIDPSQPPGAVTTVTTTSPLGDLSYAIAFDGSRIWITDEKSVSIVTPGAAFPWASTTVSAGLTSPLGLVFDGSNIWVTDRGDSTIKKLNPDGSVSMTVQLDTIPDAPAFDGTNIWVPCEGANDVIVVRASTGAVIATLSGNGLNQPFTAAFDGQRVLITNSVVFSGSVSLWRASNLTPIGTFSTGGGTSVLGACSDGVSLWVTMGGPDQLVRF
jgi:hypothetical protein